MKPQDVIEQLVGTGDDWDVIDTLSFTIGKPSKFPKAEVAFVDFENGYVALQTFNSDGDIATEEKFAIKASLEPLDVESSTGDEHAGEEDHP